VLLQRPPNFSRSTFSRVGILPALLLELMNQ
jgi:hypothetical protein